MTDDPKDSHPIYKIEIPGMEYVETPKRSNFVILPPDGEEFLVMKPAPKED
jgi:hypothetical protein